MLSIILNWIYVIYTTFTLGWTFALFCEKKLKYTFKNTDSYLLTGLIIATVYAQIWSLFAGVSLLANVCLLLICIMVTIVTRKLYLARVREFVSGMSTLKKILVLTLFILWAYFTSRGYLLYDSDLYHGQSIRWIEEYGVVAGLGNLHCRFAYNSSSFALSALFSMRFLGIQSLHAMSGFFAFILSLSALRISNIWKEKKIRLSDWAKIAAIYYLSIIINEVVSPASDYFIMCTIFFVVIKWLELLEDKETENKVVAYSLLCIVGCFAITLKLTAGLIVLLVIKPAYMLIKEKKVKEIILFLILGILIIAPWMIRTVIISGWLLYPFPNVDLFSVDWKINATSVKVDAEYIKVWARGLFDASLADKPVTYWFINWFRTQLSLFEKGMILADLLSCVLISIEFIIFLIKRRWDKMDRFLVVGTIMFSYLFWQLSAPMLRYGYTYVLLLSVLVLGYYFNFLKLDRVVTVCILLFGCYKVIMLGIYTESVVKQPYYMAQQDYGKYEVERHEIDGMTVYFPVEGDRTGYDYFPSIPTCDGIELRGDDIKDGFKLK